MQVLPREIAQNLPVIKDQEYPKPKIPYDKEEVELTEEEKKLKDRNLILKNDNPTEQITTSETTESIEKYNILLDVSKKIDGYNNYLNN